MESDVARLARRAGTTPAALAVTLDLAGAADPAGRCAAAAALLDRLAPRLGNAPAAYAWLCSVPLPGHGERSAAALLRAGAAETVVETLDAIDAGLHA